MCLPVRLSIAVQRPPATYAFEVRDYPSFGRRRTDRRGQGTRLAPPMKGPASTGGDRPPGVRLRPRRRSELDFR